ncbi:MAG: ComF family protein [Dysgonamonadaceae bacterium]|jgi:ComF family protein|nr:ComF family protein [Dysgonamonadaceae bacterium]
MNLKPYLSDFLSLFFPKLCLHCREPLMGAETFLCLHCQRLLPKTGYLSFQDNAATDRFRGKIPVAKAVSYLYYNKGGVGQKIVAEIKYRGNIRLGREIGRQLAEDLHSKGFFENVDFLVPVPLHPKKLKKRGFNQAEIIAQGVASVTKIPMETTRLYRRKANLTQTKKNVYERWKNADGIFSLRDPSVFASKHVLLVDDVLTTGATLEACAVRLLEIPQIKISLLTLAIA